MKDFRLDIVGKNNLLIAEMEKLRDQAEKLRSEKEGNELELIKLNRDILERKSRDDEQLRRLYIALDRTNPEKYGKKVDHAAMIPLSSQNRGWDDEVDPFEKLRLRWYKEEERERLGNESRNKDWVFDVNNRNAYRIHELQRVENEFDLRPEDGRGDRLDEAMLEFAYDGNTVESMRRRARKALDLE